MVLAIWLDTWPWDGRGNWRTLETEKCRLFYSDSTLGCRVIQDFDLCKLDMCDVAKGTQSGAKSQKIEYLCKY